MSNRSEVIWASIGMALLILLCGSFAVFSFVALVGLNIKLPIVGIGTDAFLVTWGGLSAFIYRKIA